MLNDLIPVSIRARVLLLDDATQWGSTFRMIKRALEFKFYYDKLCERDVDLMPYQLQEADWRYLQELHNLLRLFDTFSTKLQGNSYATIPLTIAAYNALLDNLEDFIEKDDNHNNRRQCRHTDLHRGAAAAKDKLLQYYRSTDNTPIYAVATAMHPAMRFDWWTREPQNWEKAVADEAKRVVTEIWNNQCKPDTHQGLAEQSTSEDETGDMSVYINGHCLWSFGVRTMRRQCRVSPTSPKWPATSSPSQRHQAHRNGLSQRAAHACLIPGTV